jgi:pilus assembly protein CpaC
MKFAPYPAVYSCASVGRGGLAAVPVPAAQIITTAQDMVIEINQGHLVRVDRAAAAVFVANSAIAEVAVKSPRLIFVFAKKPGVTTLYAVDKE